MGRFGVLYWRKEDMNYTYKTRHGKSEEFGSFQSCLGEIGGIEV